MSLNDYAVALGDWSAADRATLATLLDRLRVGLLHTRADESGWSVRKDPPDPPAPCASWHVTRSQSLRERAKNGAGARYSV